MQVHQAIPSGEQFQLIFLVLGSYQVFLDPIDIFAHHYLHFFLEAVQFASWELLLGYQGYPEKMGKTLSFPRFSVFGLIQYPPPQLNRLRNSSSSNSPR